MTKQEELNVLESRQLELQGIMAKSDAHASKCTKLGISFAETYPEDLAQYEAAREEYNRNEDEIANIKAFLITEEREATEINE